LGGGGGEGGGVGWGVGGGGEGRAGVLGGGDGWGGGGWGRGLVGVWGGGVWTILKTKQNTKKSQANSGPKKGSRSNKTTGWIKKKYVRVG